MRSATESSERDANGNSLPRDISAEAVRAELEKILASSGFANAERLSRFLRYAVEEHLNGQTDKLKESFLGVEVFGRKPTYDPRIDAVVRTEAVKLRARLKEYYETEGREDPLIIDLPKGGYVPAFRLPEKEAVKEDPAPVPAVEAPVSAGDAQSAVSDPPLRVQRYWSRATMAAVFVALVFAVTIYVAFRDRAHIAQARTTAVPSIAVLPFEDLSPARDEEYFCDGITEEIIDSLTQVGGFRVVARTSSFAFKGRQQDIREIGRKLNVGYLLEGSVRKDGNRLRITAQLNSVTDGYHLWSETYEREVKDVFAVQDDISNAIVNTLQVKLASPHSPRPPENIEAYDLFLQGQYHWRRWRGEGAETAIQYFEQAIAKDPKYAAAYSGIADSYTWLGFFGALPPNEAMPKAKQFAQKALELDDSSAEAHESLGYVNALYDFDWPAAERQFKRAIELNPNSWGGHFGYGIVYLIPNGDPVGGLREMKVARDIDPLSPVTNEYLGLAFQINNQPAAALEAYNKALSLDPNFAEAHLSLADIYLSERNFSEFYSELSKIRPGDAPAWRIELMRALGQAVQGNKAGALELVQKWENPAWNIWVRPTAIATVYANLRDKENTLVWLEKAYAGRDGMMGFLLHEGPFMPYRSDPRFIAIFKKVGLPQ